MDHCAHSLSTRGRSCDSRACVLMLILNDCRRKIICYFHTYTLLITSFCVRYEAPKNINTRMGHMDQLSGRVGDRTHACGAVAKRQQGLTFFYMHTHKPCPNIFCFHKEYSKNIYTCMDYIYAWVIRLQYNATGLKRWLYQLQHASCTVLYSKGFRPNHIISE